MKHLGYTFLISCCLAFSGYSQDNSSQHVINGFFDAMADLDFARMKAFCTNDMALIENGKIWNMDTLIQKLQTRKTDSTFKRVNRIKFIETHEQGSMASCYYYNQATVISKGKLNRIRWVESAVLIKQGADWKIKLLHSTVVERN